MSPLQLDQAPRHIERTTREIEPKLGVDPDSIPQTEWGFMLSSRALVRASKAAPVKIRPGMTVAEAFEVMVHACLRHYRLNEPLVIEHRDAAALHQSRVAMRRLRSAFTLFESAVADNEYQYLREELRWFTVQLGEARNLDVFLKRDLSDADRKPLSERREQAYDHVIAAMNSARLRRLMVALIGWTAFGPWRLRRKAAKPVKSYARKRLDRLWRHVKHAWADIADLSERDRHRLRIRVKKLRYGIEFLRGAYPRAHKTERRFSSAVEDLQDSLGKLHDLVIARSFVTGPIGDDWLIQAPEEHIYLHDATRASRKLKKVGPFWRGRHRSDRN